MSMPLSIEHLSSLVDTELSSIVTSRNMPLYDMMSYHMGWRDEPGRLEAGVPKQRSLGVLCLLACRAAGGHMEDALPAAAAVELVNNFCQIHDDVQGGNPSRDNRDAVWWVWGPAQAINAGDGMHALARLSLFRLSERGVSPPTTFRAIQLLDEASLRTCEGRFQDLEAQERIDLSVEKYLNMASDKSGALISCAMTLGGLVATEEKATLEALGSFGAQLGVAIQLQDNLRELWSEDEESFVPSLNLMNKTKVFPVVFALENASVSDKRKLGDIYFKRVLERDDIIGLRLVLDQLGAREGTEKLVAQCHAEALSALSTPGISDEGRADIAKFAGSLLE